MVARFLGADFLVASNRLQIDFKNFLEARIRYGLLGHISRTFILTPSKHLPLSLGKKQKNRSSNEVDEWKPKVKGGVGL
jgi:hypothetical protein